MGDIITHAPQADGIRYDLPRAVDAWKKMRELGYDGLTQLLCEAGNVVTLYYPGIGVPPLRPGGDIKFATREDLLDLVEMFWEVDEGLGHGYEVFLTGAKGIGKSCYLRALAWILMLAEHRVVCLWSMQAAYNDLPGVLVSALRFAYCCEENDVLAKIDAIRSVEDVQAFMKERNERFYLIIDGAEVLDTVTSKGKARPDKEERQAVDVALQKLVREAHVTVRGLSPMANTSRKRKADSNWMEVNQGFYGVELDAFVKHVTLLSRLSQWKDDIKHFGGTHPLSLSVLDASCRRRARTRTKLAEPSPYKRLQKRQSDPEWDDEEIAELLKDKGEWDETIKLFLSSADMTAMRTLLDETLNDLDVTQAYFRVEDMMKQDMRFVVGDPERGEARYVTPYIERMYTEGFRAAESRKVHMGAAWYHYCRHLIDGNAHVNWSEMGWLCENLVAEVISSKGLSVDKMAISNVHAHRFGTIPNFRSWFHRVKTGGSGVYFLPVKYNYRSIDGLVVWRDSTGQLHLVAIQVTVNPEKHLKSADEFMAFNTVTQWIPEAELPNWKLHFVFLCLKDASVENVEEKLETRSRSGITFGTVAYQRYTISFLTAFAGGIAEPLRKTLEQVAKLRYDASEAAADREATAEQKAMADALAAATAAAASSTKKASSQAIAAIQSILSRNEFSKTQLERLAAKFQIGILRSDSKATVVAKIAFGIMEL